MLNQFERLVAFRYLRARKEEGFISIIAWFSLIGIMLGVATLIVVMSVMNGFRAELIGKLLGVNGHVMVTNSAGIQTYDDLATRIRSMADVKSVVPVIDGQVMATFAKNSTGALVKGIAKENLEQKKIVSSNLKSGSLYSFNNGDGLLLGTHLAAKLGVKAGESITLISPDGSYSVAGFVPRVKSYLVSGTFEVGMFDYDSATIIMPMSAAQIFFRYKDTVSNIEIQLENPEEAPILTTKLQQFLSPSFTIYDWQKANEHFVSALNVERNVMFLILTLIILVAAFNIISSMIMLVKDKTKDIAVLRTMGVQSTSIMKIFIVTGATVGIIGTFSGFILGTTFALNIEKIRNFIEFISGSELFPAEIYYLSQMPSKVDSYEVMMVVIISLILSFAATIYPSWRAAKTDPAEVLRYG